MSALNFFLAPDNDLTDNVTEAAYRYALLISIMERSAQKVMKMYLHFYLYFSSAVTIPEHW